MKRIRLGVWHVHQCFPGCSLSCIKLKPDYFPWRNISTWKNSSRLPGEFMSSKPDATDSRQTKQTKDVVKEIIHNKLWESVAKMFNMLVFSCFLHNRLIRSKYKVFKKKCHEHEKHKVCSFPYHLSWFRLSLIFHQDL